MSVTPTYTNNLTVPEAGPEVEASGSLVEEGDGGPELLWTEGGNGEGNDCREHLRRNALAQQVWPDAAAESEDPVERGLPGNTGLFTEV